MPEPALNPSLIPFVLVPLIAIGAGVTLIVMAVSGNGPPGSFIVIGAVLVVIGVVLPFLFQILNRPRKN